MLTRRELLAMAGAGGVLRGAALTPRERVDRVLKGQDADRAPFTFWYHFHDENKPGSEHARLTLDFHRRLRTDLVKVMSDYPYPKPKGKWWEVKPLDNPFPEQVKALELIRDGLAGRAHFIETIFNPWNVAEKLSSKEEVLRLKAEKPRALLDALEAIAASEANHARRAVAAGAAGVFLAIANAQDGLMTREDYRKFSEPFDRKVLAAAKDAPLSLLHLHGDKVYLDLFYQGWPAAGVNYSAHGTGTGVAAVRAKCAGLIMGGLDERNFRKLSEAELKRQHLAAAKAAGKKYICAPGCSVPDDTPDAELLRVARMFGA